MPRYQVQRSIEIKASPQKVFDVIADYRTWSTWSPWLRAEPDAEVKISPNAASVGAVYSWKGEIVGQGEIEHRQLQPGRLIEDEIRFFKPFRSRSNVSFEMQPAAAGSQVTWHMRGSLPWFLFWMRSQMESFIGMDYERGLKMLKEWIETGKILSSTTIRVVESVGPFEMVGIRRCCAFKDVGVSMEAAIAEAKQKLAASNLPTDGEKISVYHAFNLKAQTIDYTSGFVMTGAVASLPAGLSSWSLPASRALCVEHIGSYENLGNAWSAAEQHVRYKKLKQSKAGTFEIYKNSPEGTATADLRTDIYLPLKK